MRNLLRRLKEIIDSVRIQLGLKEPAAPIEPPVDTPTPPIEPPANTECNTWANPPGELRGGCVWKPIAESGGNLVILINTRFRTHVAKIDLLRNGTWELLETGRFSGDTHNGCRPHYRFSRPGAHYGQDIFLRVTLKNGTELARIIPEGSQRYDW